MRGAEECEPPCAGRRGQHACGSTTGAATAAAGPRDARARGTVHVCVRVNGVRAGTRTRARRTDSAVTRRATRSVTAQPRARAALWHAYPPTSLLQLKDLRRTERPWWILGIPTASPSWRCPRRPHPPKDLPWEDAVGSGDANNEPHPGDHLPRPPLRVSHERTCHPAPALSPRGLRAGGWCRRRGEKGAPQGQAKLRQGRSTLTLGWALRACRRPISLLQEAGSGCAGASPRLGGAGRNLTHCTGHPHRRALGTSPSRGLGGHGSHQGSRQPPDPLAPRVAAPVPPWHEADKDSRHQCGVDKVCS